MLEYMSSSDRYWCLRPTDLRSVSVRRGRRLGAANHPQNVLVHHTGVSGSAGVVPPRAQFVSLPVRQHLRPVSVRAAPQSSRQMTRAVDPSSADRPDVLQPPRSESYCRSRRPRAVDQLIPSRAQLFRSCAAHQPTRARRPHS